MACFVVSPGLWTACVPDSLPLTCLGVNMILIRRLAHSCVRVHCYKFIFTCVTSYLCVRDVFVWILFDSVFNWAWPVDGVRKYIQIDMALGHRYTSFTRDMPLIGSHGFIISFNFQNARSSTVALTRSQSCKKVMWGRVIQTDLVTWPFTVGGYNLT